MGRFNDWLWKADVDPKSFRAAAARYRAAKIGGGPPEPGGHGEPPAAERQPAATPGEGNPGINGPHGEEVVRPTPRTEDQVLGETRKGGVSGDQRRPSGDGKLSSTVNRAHMRPALLSGRRMTTIMRL